MCPTTRKEKGKQVFGGDTIASALACVQYVFSTFTEVERVRQVHPRQPLMTSEEVPLLGAP